MSYKFKIAGSFFFFAALMLFVVLWQSLSFLQARLEHQVRQADRTLIEHIKHNNAVNALLTESFSALQLEFDQLVNAIDLEGIVLLDNQQVVLASSNEEWLGQSFSSVPGNVAWHVEDVTGAIGVLGKIAYQFDNARATEIRNEAFRFGAGLALTGLIILAAIGWLIGLYLARRLEKITNNLDVISSGQLEKFDVDESEDEIGMLSRFILQMGKQVSAHVSGLLEVEERNRLSLQVAGVGSWKWDAKESELSISARSYQMMGMIPSEKPDYQSWRRTIHPEDLDFVDEKVRGLWRDREILDFEYRVVRRNGEVRWMRNLAKMFVDEDGQPDVIYGLQIDITDYRHEITALDSQVNILEALLNQADTCSIWIDGEGVILWISAAALSKLGFTFKELRGKSINSILSDDALPAVEKFITHCATDNATSQQSLQRSLALTRKDGDELRANLMMATYFDKREQQQLLCTFTEIR